MLILIKGSSCCYVVFILLYLWCMQWFSSVLAVGKKVAACLSIDPNSPISKLINNSSS